ncbi:hypothetical protein QR680_014286 [Steinernema hermaphroditum]|uniref:TANC1/2-like winged helix domain-containing protein n=1 Tax=Steinernema hermaphroditum TaxID=289476 RepID=A0AA39M3N3_9BILA|nr:hypothetical protein QR680_014286 [Steinernema hermaphroditum]
MQQQENRRSFNGFGSLRRSLRQINPFRNQLFRLPATPRLSRSRKVTSGVEDATEWNFERPPSCTASTSRQSTIEVPQITSERRAGSLRGAPRPPDETLSVGRAGGSVRLGRPPNKQRPPICRQFLDPPPPDPQEAECAIREQMKKLMSPASARRQQFLQLPNTSYAPSGEIYDAYWMEDSLSSPAYSTISLLQGANGSARPMSSASSTLRRQSSIFNRNSFQLNGIHPHDVAVRLKSPNAKTSQVLSKFQILFEIQDAIPDSALESVFLGREWVFKELYQMLIVDQCQFVLVEGGPGTGKTAILSQILLHSPLLQNGAKSNGNTVDSGIVVSSSQTSLHDSPQLSSVNYEWLRGVGAQVVGFHFCRLGSAASCSIPEFICNLAAQLIRVPALVEYLELVGKSGILQNMLTLNECSRHDSLMVFRKVVVEPLQQVKVNESCLIVLIDSIDEAEFHRNEDGASIEWLLGEVKDELPSYLRFVLTSSNRASVRNLNVRTLQIDDTILDERVFRDSRIFLEYLLTVAPELERRICESRSRFLTSTPPLAEFFDQVLEVSQGNHLFIQLSLDLSKPELQLASQILAVIIASLKPLDASDITAILNSANADPSVDQVDVQHRLDQLTPFVVKHNSGVYLIQHNSFREWLLKGHDVRHGHILHALRLCRKGELPVEELFELGHHLLKANPHKYMREEVAMDMPRSKDCQLLWTQIAAGRGLPKALLYPRNVHYTNSKVSRLLLLSGASADACWDIEEGGNSLLASFSAVGNTVMVQLLIEHGAHVNRENPMNGKTAIVIAAGHGHLEVVKILRTNGGDCGEALIHAAEMGHLGVVAYLLKEDATKANDAFEKASERGHVRICDAILSGLDGVDMARGMRAACRSGQAQVVQFLFSRGAKFSTGYCDDGKSALICAIESGSWDLVVNVLMNSGIDVNADRTSEGLTPLMVAAKHGHVGLVDLLINKGASMNASDLKGRTALMHAVLNHHISTSSLLLERGASASTTDSLGNSILHIIAESQTTTGLDTFLDVGGLSLEAKNSAGLRPVEVAIKVKNSAAVDAFLRRGARLRTASWQTALDYEAKYVLVLLRKLLDDANILFHRKNTAEAQHRLKYALNKVSELLQTPQCLSILQKLLNIKFQILLTTAKDHRRHALIREAVEVLNEALDMVNKEMDGSPDHKFDLLLMRAKTNFDGQDVAGALRDAEAAARIRPDNADVRNLLSILSIPKRHTLVESGSGVINIPNQTKVM